ncbi:hypothetical protein CRENBAI_005018 [Crenichthys baileyi]|uniref:Uncharacterized protein n=1 Tax=Crenichthys baileyi TaxID=28760 RepID=A0AAV9QSM8_9TELE
MDERPHPPSFFPGFLFRGGPKPKAPLTPFWGPVGGSWIASLLFPAPGSRSCPGGLRGRTASIPVFPPFSAPAAKSPPLCAKGPSGSSANRPAWFQWFPHRTSELHRGVLLIISSYVAGLLIACSYATGFRISSSCVASLQTASSCVPGFQTASSYVAGLLIACSYVAGLLIDCSCVAGLQTASSCVSVRLNSGFARDGLRASRLNSGSAGDGHRCDRLNSGSAGNGLWASPPCLVVS